MLRTYYAGGRSSLPAPVVTLGTGSMNGSGNTYYLWIVARNRVGYNSPSPSTSIVIGASKSLILSAANFTSLSYEDWHSYIVSINTVDNYSTSRVIYETVNSGTANSSAVTINSQIILGNSYQVANPSALPSVATLPNGYRVSITSLNNIYKYDIDNSSTVDNLTVLSTGQSSSRWVLANSNSLNETVANYDKELFQVTQSDMQPLNLPANASNLQPVKYFIKNTNIDSVDEGELDLNIYQSDKGLQVGAKIKVLGYLDMQSYVLDTADIPYIGSLVNYPEDSISLVKSLPSNSSLVFEVVVDITNNQTVLPGTYISLYPRLNTYVTVETVEDWASAVPSISALQALPANSIKDGQSVHVASVNKIYTYNSSSTLTVDGDSIVKPTFNPIAGRWRATSSTVLNASITEDKLAPQVLALLGDNLENVSQVLNASTSFTLDFETISKDYYILTTPEDDNGTTVINFKHDSLQNGVTVSKLLELSQRSGEVGFHTSILFPGGNLPVLSGDGKTDLILLTLRKDSTGTVKKRASLLQKNIG